MSIYHPPPTRQTSAHEHARAAFFSHRLRNNNRGYFSKLFRRISERAHCKNRRKKRWKKTTRPSKRGTLSAVARSTAIERFLRVRTRARTVDEYNPRAIISTSPQAQRLDSKLVESIRRTNRGFDALRRRVDATTDSVSELSKTELECKQDEIIVF